VGVVPSVLRVHWACITITTSWDTAVRCHPPSASPAYSPESVKKHVAGPQTVFHIASLALFPPDGYAWAGFLGELNQQGICTSVDVNVRRLPGADNGAYTELLLRVMPQARVLKVSDEDLQQLGLGHDPLHAARTLLNDTTQVVLLTRGSLGAWCLTAEGAWHEPAPNTPVCDTVAPMATPNCSTYGRSNCSRQDRVDYDDSGLMAMRAAASLRR